jgi:cyclopropane-fatty-acyl-phospholipid synthase
MFEQFLDSKMMYSSAIYPGKEASLEVASEYKLALIAEKLAIQAGDHILEIGSGWGGMAIYLASHFDCHVTTTTISQAQFDEARRRIDAAGLSDRITLLLRDYRDLVGQYDKIVSIEMIEAVGLDFLPTYFKQCSSLLKPNGLMVLQSITIADQRYDYAAKHVDFIQRYIFPGGALPSAARILECMRDHTAMQLRGVQDIGLDYAQTLHDWRLRFFQNWPAIHQLGYDERFKRLWHYYLCYCEGGFLERAISCAHFVFHKPEFSSSPS